MLVWKLSLSSQATVHRHRIFYLWQDTAGMNGFLGHPGFAALTQSYGWPSVKTWSVWAGRALSDARNAAWATREVSAIPPFADLDGLRRRETEALEADLESSAIAGVGGYEPTTWTQVRFRLWRDRPVPAPGRLIYEVGHVSLPGGGG